MIRTYQDTDLKAVITLFLKNTPEYFSPKEEIDLRKYLELEIEEYYVIEKDGHLICCGGINYFLSESKARLSWDIVDPDFQGKGFGRMLVQFRIQRINQQNKIKIIEVRTSQKARQFYEKMGFELNDTKKDYWAKGLDMIRMTKHSGN